LNRPRVALRYSARTSSYFKQLTSKLPVSSDNNYVCYECINVTGSGHGNPKFFGCASCTHGWTRTPFSKFLDPPLYYALNVPFAPFLQTRGCASRGKELNGLTKTCIQRIFTSQFSEIASQIMDFALTSPITNLFI